MGPIKKFLSTDLLVLYVVITSLFLNIPVFFFCVPSRGLIACPYSFEIHTIKRNFLKKAGFNAIRARASSFKHINRYLGNG